MNPQQQNKSVLGRGLGSLLPGASAVHSAAAPQSAVIPPPAPAAAVAGIGVKTETSVLNTAPVQSKDRQMGISVLSVDEIAANPNQPRKEFDPSLLAELCASIKENGLIQPLVVRRTDKGYELIAGERRLRASKLAGLKVVPVVIRKSTDRESLELAIVENIQRENLNCVDEALAYFRLLNEYQLSQEELAKKMGKERSTVANSLRILKLSEPILVKLKRGELTQGHAKALLSVEDATRRDRLSQQISNLGLNVRQAEKMAQNIREKKASGDTSADDAAPIHSALFSDYADKLKKVLRTKVKVASDNGISGKIEISFGSKEECDRIIDNLLGGSR